MRDDPSKLLSTAEVAAHLDVTRQRVLELISEQRLPAIKVGRAYVVRAGDLASLTLHKVGRPTKSSPAPEKRATAAPKRDNGTARGKKKGGRK